MTQEHAAPPETPRVGMVVSYNYLWARQANQGMDVGEKIRPCAILAVQEGKDEDGKPQTTVFVSPITHTPPFNPRAGIVLGGETQRRLGIGYNGHDSWLMCSEVNKFTWPGYDLFLAHRYPKESYVFGDLPRAVLMQAREKLADFYARQRLKFVPRDPEMVRAEGPR